MCHIVQVFSSLALIFGLFFPLSLGSTEPSQMLPKIDLVSKFLGSFLSSCCCFSSLSFSSVQFTQETISLITWKYYKLSKKEVEAILPSYSWKQS